MQYDNSVPGSPQWDRFYLNQPLHYVRSDYEGLSASPFIYQYLRSVLLLCPPGGRTLETGIGTGLGAVWLARRGVQAEGLDISARIIERARAANDVLGGSAQYRVGDMFNLWRPGATHYSVIHHQGVAEHLTVPCVRAVLAQQVASADHVVFSVPSVYYPYDPEFGDERLLPLEEWQRILEPFHVAELAYYGDPALGGREHVLVHLTGQQPDPALMALMHPGPEPFAAGISAIVHTRDSERKVAECLDSLQGWTDEIIVCDMDSGDATLEIAAGYTSNIVSHPLIANFDGARNVSAMRATHRWVFYLDDDERVPPRLGPAIRNLVEQEPVGFDAVLFPFRHHFAGKWMTSLYPGYTSPRLFRNGRFHFNPRPHTGAQVYGRTALFPARDSDLAIVHHSFESMSHYLRKLDRYTDAEAASMDNDGRRFSWRAAVETFAHDLSSYYDVQGSSRDGVHGLAYAFLSGFYRFEQHTKLYERRWRSGRVEPSEEEVPSSAEAILEHALATLRQRPASRAVFPVLSDAPDAADVLWSGPLLSASGYGHETRQLLFALEDAGVSVAAHALEWGGDPAEVDPGDRERVARLGQRPARERCLHVVQNLVPLLQRHPGAPVAVARTMFETDRLPEEWAAHLRQMDWVWVPTEFNRQTFAESGVPSERILVVPGALDTARYTLEAGTQGPAEAQTDGRFLFVSVFDWTLHKGWDVLLRTFGAAFGARDDALLLLKVWSSTGYTADQIEQQARACLRSAGHEAAMDDGRIRFLHRRMVDAELLDLYRCADALVLPSRGEGWGRPQMEAMALGKPVIGTAWSGNTAFMNAENSLLVPCKLVPVTEEGAREVPAYAGHRWAEPDPDALAQQMLRMADHRDVGRSIGVRARTDILAGYAREAVGPIIAAAVHSAVDAAASAGRTISAPTTAPHARGKAKRRSAAPPLVKWQGAFFEQHSLAHVNREICKALVKAGGVELTLAALESCGPGVPGDLGADELRDLCFAAADRPVDIHVRHSFPPQLALPTEGRLVLIQPWEYGFLPNEWLDSIQRNVAEVWCYSGYVRDVYRASDVPDSLLQVTPLGVDTRVIGPQAPPFVPTQEPGAARWRAIREPFTFLFLGGTLHRKGIDILLAAYQRAFTPLDDVCLIIKDTGTETVYRGQNAREQIVGLAADESRPPIVYVERDMAPHQLAGLYTAADCIVLPYRGEGFCLPALECMACGRPAIVPAGGPTDDFVDETVGWRVPAEHVPFGEGRIGHYTCCGPTWMFEIGVDDLARQMRQVRGDVAEARARGARALQRVQADWTWDHAARRVADRISALRSVPARRSQAPPPARARSRKPTVALCMIVKNEERCLAEALASVAPYVDQMVVVDTGSIDRTVEIALEAGAEVFHTPWDDDFARARNVSFDHSRCDWNFWMDGDDTLPAGCGPGLREAALMAEDRCYGFLMQVHVPAAPGEFGVTVVDHVKLVRNLPGIRFEGRIHEQLLGAIRRLGGDIARTSLHVVHTHYDHSPAGQAAKLQRDLRILELELAERPDDAFAHFNLGMTRYFAGDLRAAITALHEALARSGPDDSTLRKVYSLLVGSHAGLGERSEAREWLEKGLARYPRDPELLYRAGTLFADLGDLPAAERHLVRLLSDAETGHIDSVDISIRGFRGRHMLGVVLARMGREEDAMRQWQAALAERSDYRPALVAAAEWLIARSRFAEARVHVDRLSAQGAAEAIALSARLPAGV